MEARQELHRVINDREMKEAIILVFANKQDLDNGWFCLYFCSMSPTQSRIEHHCAGIRGRY